MRKAPETISVTVASSALAIWNTLRLRIMTGPSLYSCLIG